MNFARTIWALAALISLGLYSANAHAALISSGDILVVDASAFGSLFGGLIGVDPVTGDQTAITMETGRRTVAVESDGNILVADKNVGGEQTVFRVDPNSGDQTVLSSGEFLRSVQEIAIADDGTIFVIDAINGVIRINPDDGSQVLVSSGGLLDEATGIAINSLGDLFVSDGASVGAAEIIQIDPISGSQTLITSDGLLGRPHHLAFDLNDDLLVADLDLKIVQIDLDTMMQEIISSGAFFCFPTGVAVDAGGDILVSDGCFGPSSTGGVISIDPLMGGQSIVSTLGFFNDPWDLIVYPSIVPEPSTLALFATGLAGLGFMGWRRRKVKAA